MSLDDLLYPRFVGSEDMGALGKGDVIHASKTKSESWFREVGTNHEGTASTLISHASRFEDEKGNDSHRSGESCEILPGQDARIVEFEIPFSPGMVQFSSSVYDVESTFATLRATNEVYWPMIHITEGLRFPLLALVHEFLHYTKIHPAHIHVNVI